MGDASTWSVDAPGARRRRSRADGRDAALTLYQHTAAELQGRRGPDFFRMNPCDTFRVFRFQVAATCMSCGATRPVTQRDLDDTPWAHRHWPVVLAKLICVECGGHAGELRFSHDRGGDVGVITTEQESVLRLATGSAGITKAVRSVGAIDAYAQHDDATTLSDGA